MTATVATETKMPEEQQEEQSEEITLTDEDLNVIDELETDQEITESTETAEVEAVAEETQSSDDSSTTEEPEGQMFNPDLTARATQYGLDPSGFANEQALQHVVQQFDQGNEQLSQWNNWYQGQQQTTEEQPPQRPQFSVELGEDYDEGLKSAINAMAANMQSHYDNQLNLVAQSILDQQNAIQYQQQYVTLAENQQQQQQAAGELEQFNSAVNRLSNEGLFGDQPYESLDAQSPEAKNMESLYERMTVLANGYQASNQVVPSVDELVKQAYHVTFADEINNQSRTDFNNRMKSNSRRRLGGGGTTAAHTEPAMDADEAVNSQVLKDFYDAAIAESGS